MTLAERIRSHGETLADLADELDEPSKKLTTFFTDVADDCLHVIAKAPGMS